MYYIEKIGNQAINLPPESSASIYPFQSTRQVQGLFVLANHAKQNKDPDWTFDLQLLFY